MFLKAKLTIVACALLSLHVSAQVQSASTNTTMAIASELGKTQFVKSTTDDRTYDEITLENGIKVVLVSDANSHEAAVSLSVGVGQFQDPDNYQGLAHFLEHMIFQGSAQYPTPGALMSYLAEHNGKFNAVTEAQSTTYFFSAPQTQFEQALSILSDSLVNPLFKKEAIDKEIHAIDQEWQRLRQQDSFAMIRTTAMTGNPSHPVRKFGIGNQASLSNKEGDVDVYTAMRAFYDQYYSSNIMTLALVGNAPIAELKAMATKYFGPLKNKHITRPLTQERYFSEAVSAQEIKLKTKLSNDLLVLQFPLPSNLATWQYKPNAYLQMLLSSQEPGSLSATLLEQNLIEAMIPMFMPNSYGSEGTAIIQFVLTSQGKTQKDKVIAAFFDYIALLKDQGVTQAYAAELKHNLEGQFHNYVKPPALHLAMQFSRAMQSVPAKDVLHFDTYFKAFNPDLIHQVLDNFSLNAVRIWHINDEVSASTPLNYAQGYYDVANITPAAKKLYQGSGFTFALHTPELTEKEVTTDIIENINTPKQVVNDKGISAWLKTSEHFSQRQGVLGITIESPILNQDLKHHTLLNLVNIMMIRDIQTLATRAQQRHQINLMAMQNSQGNFAITLAGNANKQAFYAEKLFDALVSLELSEARLNAAKKLYEESLDNMENLPLATQSELHFGRMVKSHAALWSSEETKAQLQALTLQDLAQFHKRLLGETYLDVFAFGKYQTDEIKTLAITLRSKLGKSTQTHKPKLANVYRPAKQTSINQKVSSNLDNVYLRESYLAEQTSAPQYAHLMVINQLLNSALYNLLRTEKQLAYSVGSTVFKVHQYPAISLYMESANTSLPAIKAEFDAFILSFFESLKQVDESVFDSIKAAFISQLEQKPENIFIESQPYFEDWLSHQLSFDSVEQLKVHLNRTTKAQVLDTFKALILDYTGQMLVLQIKGEQSKGGFYDFPTQAEGLADTSKSAL